MKRHLYNLTVAVVALAILILPSYAAISNISGFTTQADGNTITASIWNSQIGGIYTYINTNLVAALNKLTTKGDLFVTDGSALNRLGVGTNGQVLQANSAATYGVNWASVSTVTNLTTKGDLLGYDTGLNRIAVGTNGQVLTADSSAGTGVSWQTPSSIPTGIISLWSGSIASIPSGWHLADGTSGTPNLQGLFIVGAGNVSPAATGGMGLVSPGGPAGDTSAGTGLGPSHSHTYGSSNTFSAGASAAVTSASPTNSATITPRYYALAYIQKI